jgi:RND family efflux transporter MFP subunit
MMNNGYRTLAVVFWSALATQSLPADFDCTIEARQVLELRSPIEGLIERVNVDRGDLVKKGQELIVLDSAVERAQGAIAKQRAEMDGAIRSGESRVEFSSNKHDRAEELHRQKFVSAEARDQAATERKLAEAELRDARDNRVLADLEYKRQNEIIRLKTVRSPINGVVIERILNPGELAEAGVGRKPILKLAEIDVLYVEVMLPVDAYGQIKRGMEVEVTPEIPAGTHHRATVKVIDRMLDAASGTFGVRLELPNQQHKLPAGIRCKANFPSINANTPSRARSVLREGPPPKPALRPSNGIEAR